MKHTRKPATRNAKRRDTPRFPGISVEMQHWSAMLETEVDTWPGVVCKRMFGFRSIYRRRTIFAALPYTRGLFTPSSILLKFDPMPAALFQQAQREPRLDTSTRIPGKGWFSFEISSNEDLRDALWWLSRAYDSTKSATR